MEVDVRTVAAASSLESVTALLAGPASPAVKVHIYRAVGIRCTLLRGRAMCISDYMQIRTTFWWDFSSFLLHSVMFDYSDNYA